MPSPVHVAFLGCGFITGVHSGHLRQLRGVVAASYASRDPDRAKAFRARHRGVRSYGNYGDAIDDPGVDAVVVAVPPRFHLELTLRALAAGKHVLVEKPAFPRLADYEQVREARDHAGRVVLVGENDHYKPLAVCLRRLLAEGAIGEIVLASFTTLARRLKAAGDWRNDEAMAGGDAFFEEGIHWLHLANSLGPAITAIHGFRPPPSRTGPDRRAKSMLAAFRYDTGAAGSLHYSREVPSLLRGLRLSKLFGRDGIITFESNGAFVLVRGRARAWPRLLLPGVRDIRGYQAMYRDFAAAIRDGRVPQMSLEVAMDDQRLMERIQATADRATADGAAADGPPADPAAADAPTTDGATAGGSAGDGAPAYGSASDGGAAVGAADSVANGRRGPMRDAFDLVVIGSGAGGGTLVHALAPTGARILLLERGGVVPREPENWDPAAVWKQLRYRADDSWLSDAGPPFRPYTHYCVGGNTKFWGSVLYRLRREDFGVVEHAGGVSPAWPIDYDTLAPYYERAERLYQVHGEAGLDPTEPPRGPYPHPPVPHAPEIEEIAGRLRADGLHPSPLPLGLIRPGEAAGCILCDTCNSFPCRLHAKSEAEVCCVAPATKRPNVTLWTGALAGRLVTDPSGRRVTAVEVVRNGETAIVEAPLFVVSCGAVNSAVLLLRSGNDRHPDGLANSSGLVGRRYMAHHATMMQGFHPFRRNRAVFQKTVAINDYYLRGPDGGPPLGQIQSQGRTHAVMAQTVVPWVPLRAYAAWVARGVDWLAMTEDLPRPENAVTLDAGGRIHLRYRPDNVRAHRRLVREMRRILRRLGFWVVMTHSHGARNTTHQCGTACFGRDPRTSVLDPFCRSHDVENLFVVDASFFPSSAAVNPGLTIAAQALRVADHIAETDLRVGAASRSLP